MLKNIILYFILAATVIIAQPNKENTSSDNSIYLDSYYIVNNDKVDYYLFYKVPNSSVVFIKNNESYSGEVRLGIEVFKGKDFLMRDYEEISFTANEFTETESKQLFKEGFFKFNTDTGLVRIIPIITDHNINKEINLPEIKVLAKTHNNFYIEPIITNYNELCEGKTVITNFEGFIPFSENKFNILLPVLDTTINSLSVKILNNNDTIFSGALDKSSVVKIGYEKCNDKLVLDNNGIKSFRIFEIDNISHLLSEGSIKIYVADIAEMKNKAIELKVNWFNKPRSLRNPEFAIKTLKVLGDNNLVDSLLSFDKKEYQEKLISYWNKTYPSKNGVFNPLMNKFYERVDIALKNYTTINGILGINTDRGKIYILYSSPDRVDREYDKNGNPMEIWHYEKLNKKFLFKDTKGTGEYSLVNS